MEKFKGIIFDFNGTLFWDSEKHLKAWREFSKRLRGTSFSDEEMHKYMFGRTNKDIIAYAIGKTPSDTLVSELAEEKESIYRNMCIQDKLHLHLAKGAVELFEYLNQNNIPMTIATMSEKPNVDFYIKEFELAKWFDLSKIVYSNGKIKGKPAPDIFEIAAKNLELQPKDCIVVEDAISGIEAAHNAKIGKIIAITSMNTESFYKSNPFVDEIIHDFTQINKTEFEINKKVTV